MSFEENAKVFVTASYHIGKFEILKKVWGNLHHLVAV